MATNQFVQNGRAAATGTDYEDDLWHALDSIGLERVSTVAQRSGIPDTHPE
jgi:hypothetical protein